MKIWKKADHEAGFRPEDFLQEEEEEATQVQNATSATMGEQVKGKRLEDVPPAGSAGFQEQWRQRAHRG